MQEQTDAQLLRDYAEHRDEAAFREIVHRHADVVYASASRQVSSPDLAHDIAQSVFTDLARKAQPLSEALTGDASLLGWLFRSTRFLALNQLRDDRRRQVRERQAMENFDPASETAPEWERVQPVLDEAMADLSDEDREALLLRFFKNRDFRAIGAALGVSDDAAQKRVSRALERLRTQLTSRGVATTAVALSTVLSTNAVPLAPAGLAATLSTAALTGTTLATTATATAIKTIAMTTFQKTVVAAALAIVAGAGIYEARQASKLREQNQALQQQQAPLAEQLQQLTKDRDDDARQLAALRNDNERLNRNTGELLKLRGEVARLRSNASVAAVGDDQNQSAVKSLLDRVNKIKQKLEETPSAKIPELQFLTDEDWVDTVRGNLESEADLRKAFSNLRGHGEHHFLELMQTALKKFIKANNEQFPTELSQLKPYFETTPSDDMLQRYKIVPAGSLASVLSGADWLITQKIFIDEENDTQYDLGRNGLGGASYRDAAALNALAPAVEAFKAAAPTNTDGRVSFSLQQLVPYLTTPEQKAAYDKLTHHRSSDSK